MRLIQPRVLILGKWGDAAKPRRIIKSAIYQHNYEVKSKLYEVGWIVWNRLIGNNPVFLGHDSNVSSATRLDSTAISSPDLFAESISAFSHFGNVLSRQSQLRDRPNYP